MTTTPPADMHDDHAETALTPNTTTAPPDGMIHNVFAGNPGSGKSTIANTLIGHQVFLSGVSLGTGLTTVLDTKEHNGEKFSDTPGLDDVRLREAAAAEISKGLSHAENLRLIFVCTLEDGRVRPADVVTIETILEAITAVGVSVDDAFSVIINKCNDGVLAALENEQARNNVVQAFSCNNVLKHVFFAPKCESAEGKTNALLPIQDDLKTFLQQAPILHMPGGPVTVDLAHYQQRLEQLMSEISNLRSMITDLQEHGVNDQNRQMWRNIVSSAAFAIAFGALKKYLPRTLAALL